MEIGRGQSLQEKPPRLLLKEQSYKMSSSESVRSSGALGLYRGAEDSLFLTFNLGEMRFGVNTLYYYLYDKFASFNETQLIIKKALGAHYVPNILLGSVGI